MAKKYLDLEGLQQVVSSLDDRYAKKGEIVVSVPAVKIDTSLKTDSTNCVQNKVVATAVNGLREDIDKVAQEFDVYGVMQNELSRRSPINMAAVFDNLGKWELFVEKYNEEIEQQLNSGKKIDSGVVCDVFSKTLKTIQTYLSVTEYDGFWRNLCVDRDANAVTGKGEDAFVHYLDLNWGSKLAGFEFRYGIRLWVLSKETGKIVEVEQETTTEQVQGRLGKFYVEGNKVLILVDRTKSANADYANLLIANHKAFNGFVLVTVDDKFKQAIKDYAASYNGKSGITQSELDALDDDNWRLRGGGVILYYLMKMLEYGDDYKLVLQGCDYEEIFEEDLQSGRSLVKAGVDFETALFVPAINVKTNKIECRRILLDYAADITTGAVGVFEMAGEITQATYEYLFKILF